MKRIWAAVISLMLVAAMLVGCTGKTTGSSTKGDTATGEQTTTDGGTTLDTSKTVKIGILVSDTTSAEALAFQTYYKDYIGKQYNVELIYSDELKDAAGEKSAIDTFITNNCKAIISLSSFDRVAQLTQCSEAGIYYAVATGTLTDDEYAQVKDNEYYVGAVGPSLEVEYQTGYDMAKYYLDKGVKNFAIFGGAVPYYTEMHIYRVAGMLMAMADATGKDYKGANTKEVVVGQIMQDAAVDTTAIGDVNILGYVGGYDMDDAWFGKCAQMAQTPELEVILAVGNGSDFFGTAVQGTEVKIASVDAYASSYGDAMKSGMLDYLAGKFSASIGPIFIAAYSAALGAPIRTADNEALALDQGYWIATSYEDFEKYYAVDSSIDAPAYTKEDLDTLLGADYNTFADFVSKYTFEDISK